MAWLVVFVCCLFVWILQMRFPLISIFNIFCILQKKNASLFNQNNSKHYKGVFHSKKSRPFSHPLLPVFLASPVLLASLPVQGRYCVLSSPDVDLLCLESPPRHRNPSGLSLTHPGKSFLTQADSQASEGSHVSLWHFLIVLIKVTAASIASLSFYGGHPQHGFWTWERDQASILSSGCPACLVFHC